MSKDKALLHMMSWAIQHIYNTHKETLEVMDNKEMPESEKVMRLKGPWGSDHRLLNFFVLLSPALNEAKEAFPEQDQFFKWFEERMAYIKENNLLQGECGCVGCKE